MNKICYFVFGLNPILLLTLYFFALFIFRKQLLKYIDKPLIPYLIILIIPTIVFLKILRNDPFFLSDDFAHLALFSQNSYVDIAKAAFLGPGIWVGHRIVLAFWLLKIIFDLWGTNIFSYTIVVYLLNSLNVVLFFLVSKEILKNKIIALLISVAFGSFYLVWISNVHELLAGSLVLLTALFWFRWLFKGGRKWFSLALTTYVLAFMTKEITFLLAPALIIITVFSKKFFPRFQLIKSFRSLLLVTFIFVLYLIFYARGFLGYFGIKQGIGYNMSLNPEIFLGNLNYYSSFLFPFLAHKPFYILTFFVLFPLLDVIKKRILLTPFILSYLILLTPPLLFSARVSGYYSYIPSIFGLLAFGLLLQEIWIFVGVFLKEKTGQMKQIIACMLILLVFIFGFGINRLFLDNCFLIQSPWKKTYKEAFYSLVSRIDGYFSGGQIKNGQLINLSDKENVSEVGFILENNILPIFLKNPRARTSVFNYDPETKTLQVDMR
jgi:hypothetical protein